MEKLELFLKKNKVKRENIQYPATTSLVDENGEPLLWELRAVTTKENNKLVDEAVALHWTGRWGNQGNFGQCRVHQSVYYSGGCFS